MPTQYCNTDLCLASPTDLRPLAAHLKSKGLSVLYVTLEPDNNWYGTFEAGGSGLPDGQAETDINQMLTAVESLPAALGAVWNGCTKREFDIGYDCGTEPWAFQQDFPPELLGRMAALGITMGLTLYPEKLEDESDEQQVDVI